MKSLTKTTLFLVLLLSALLTTAQDFNPYEEKVKEDNAKLEALDVEVTTTETFDVLALLSSNTDYKKPVTYYSYGAEQKEIHSYQESTNTSITHTSPVYVVPSFSNINSTILGNLNSLRHPLNPLVRSYYQFYFVP